MNVDQLINSLCRGDDDAATFRRIEVDPGVSLAEHSCTDWSHRHSSVLKCRRGSLPQVWTQTSCHGIGGKAKVLGKVEMRSGMGGVNGMVKYTVVDSPAVPPLTPASLFKQVGAVI